MRKVIRFTASWCQPCKTLAKILEQEGINIPTVVDIDTAEGKALVAHYNIRSVPTILVETGVCASVKYTGAALTPAAKDAIREALA